MPIKRDLVPMGRLGAWPEWGVAIFAILLILIAAAMVFLVYRRRRQPAQTSNPTPTARNGTFNFLSRVLTTHSRTSKKSSSSSKVAIIHQELNADKHSAGTRSVTIHMPSSSSDTPHMNNTPPSTDLPRPSVDQRSFYSIADSEVSTLQNSSFSHNNGTKRESMVFPTVRMHYHSELGSGFQDKRKSLIPMSSVIAIEDDVHPLREAALERVGSMLKLVGKEVEREKSGSSGGEEKEEKDDGNVDGEKEKQATLPREKNHTSSLRRPKSKQSLSRLGSASKHEDSDSSSRPLRSASNRSATGWDADNEDEEQHSQSETESRRALKQSSSVGSLKRVQSIKRSSTMKTLERRTRSNSDLKNVRERVSRGSLKREGGGDDKDDTSDVEGVVVDLYATHPLDRPASMRSRASRRSVSKMLDRQYSSLSISTQHSRRSKGSSRRTPGRNKVDSVGDAFNAFVGSSSSSSSGDDGGGDWRTIGTPEVGGRKRSGTLVGGGERYADLGAGKMKVRPIRSLGDMREGRRKAGGDGDGGDEIGAGEGPEGTGMGASAGDENEGAEADVSAPRLDNFNFAGTQSSPSRDTSLHQPSHITIPIHQPTTTPLTSDEENTPLALSLSLTSTSPSPLTGTLERNASRPDALQRSVSVPDMKFLDGGDTSGTVGVERRKTMLSRSRTVRRGSNVRRGEDGTGGEGWGRSAAGGRKSGEKLESLRREEEGGGEGDDDVPLGVGVGGGGGGEGNEAVLSEDDVPLAHSVSLKRGKGGRE
ncbi:hypothetical protein HDV00_008923 [Rhizophlyctis rosea]|nr:hypothetical protein HDV00_008923 [Rhizophlyctis rosea]